MPFAKRNQNKNSQPSNQSKHIFIGRTQELEFFEQSILRPLDYPTHNIIDISGDGGIGKSTLLRRFNDLILNQEFKEYCLAAQVDEFQTTPAAIMKRFAEQLDKVEHKLDKFTTELNSYEEALKKLRLEGEANRDVSIRKVFDLAGSVVDDLPVVGGLLKESTRSAVEYLLNENRTRRLLKDVERLEDPIGKLTKAFVTDLNRILDVQVGRNKRSRRLVLFFDTFERSGLEAAPWILDNFLKDNDLNPNIVLVIAGRDVLYKTADHNSKWLEYRDDIKCFQLQFFDLEQTRLYLVQFGVTEPKEVERISALSGGLPFFLDLIVASPEDTTNPTRDVVKRFLKWIPEEEITKRRLVIDAALFTQPFNQDDLEAFGYVSENERAELYEWLSNLTFVRVNSVKGGCYYHDLARELFGREFYDRTRKEYYKTRKAIAAYYEKCLEDLEKEGGKGIFKTSEWLENAKILIEQLFLLPDETSHVKAMQYVLTSYWHSKYEQEIINLLQIILEERNNTQINSGALHLIKLLLEYIKIKNNDSNFLAVVNQLIPKTKILPSFPLDILARIYDERGEAYQLQKNFKQAIINFNQAIALDPKEAYYFGMRAYAYIKQGKFEEAIADFDQAIALDPKNNIPFALRATTYRRLGKFEEAIADYTQAISFNPKYASHFGGRGKAYQEQGNYEQAIADFSQAITLNTKYAWAFAERGQAYRQQGKFEEAIADFSQAIVLNPKDASYFARRGETHRRQGNYEQAIVDFDQAITLNTKYEWAIAMRGEAYRLQGKFEEAIADYDQAIVLNPKYAWDFACRGLAYLGLEKLNMAKKDFGYAVELDPTFAGSQFMIVWLELLDTIENQEVAEQLEKAYFTKPEEYNAMVCGGVMYWLHEQNNESLLVLEKAVQKNPEVWGAFFWQGLVKAELNQDEEALFALKQALHNKMPPILLQALRRVRGRPDFYEQIAKPALLSATT